jgi:hypothetical protein
MPDDAIRTFFENLRRFFWHPRRASRAAPLRPLAAVWLFCVAAGAGVGALGWGDGFAVMMFAPVYAMLDDVIAGVRHRWAAFAAGLAAGYWAGRLVRPGADVRSDAVWADYPSLVLGSLAALAVFAAISRLPRAGANPPER